MFNALLKAPHRGPASRVSFVLVLLLESVRYDNESAEGNQSDAEA